ncbi:hypothetical protein [Pedobacter gandavensis]|uniref:hypothetical protein n=1 Tax=Pedobacter gandavensis TaxID=2679963 RepID=UPI00293175FB|nr:hypothetical protein [Pedobacter gandavensis]
MLESIFTLKAWFIKILALFLVFFEPAQQTAYLLLFLIFMDATTSLWLKIRGKENINVKSFLSKVMQDVTLFFIFLLSIHYFQVAFLQETFTAFKLLASIPIFALLSQIIVNIEKLTGLAIATKTTEILNSMFQSLSAKIITKKDDEKPTL